MYVFAHAVAALSRLCGALAMVLLASAVLVVSQMVVIRYFLNASTVWQTEYVIYAATAATMLGAPYVALLGGHVGVDVVTERMGRGGRTVSRIIAALASMVFIAAVFWSGALFLWETIENGWTTDTVWKLPLWIPFWPVPFGFGVLLLQYVVEIMAALNPDLDDRLRADIAGLHPGEVGAEALLSMPDDLPRKGH
ncbi:TRAP transporter small permease subunit [uncultured Paracoccus sp.]|uniref:TRAP transporter small permease subunit n=1 Tax=uncultured Paracoccus sp. TaxID=189685 RepID=UPI0026171EC2|nr:TRAP transporter small permease [uncultured Paracoccus sp.]